MQRYLAILTSLILAFAFFLPAIAQSEARIDFHGLQTVDFPAMTATLDVFDAEGGFVSGLTKERITVLEDDQPLLLDSLQELHPGAQFVIAINPGPVFAIRDTNAISRCDKLLSALRNWASALPSDAADDLSLVTTDGQIASHLKEASVFPNILSAYQPEPRAITPSLGTLAQALDIAAEPVNQSGMKRAVLFITPLPDNDSISALQSLTARAVQLEIHIYVWMVAPADYFSTSGASALKDLAIQTGGQAFAFSGQENLPNPETYLDPLRHTYLLSYSSRIKFPGNHTLVIRVDLNGQTVSSAPSTFDLDVQPPNPILVSIPEQIVRQSSEEETNAILRLTPTEQAVEIIVEFPDGHPRPLVRTSLYIDGQVTAENTVAPFDKFIWDLSSITSTGQHILQVEAVDSLGLSKVSLGVPVTVTIIMPQRDLKAVLMRNSLWLAGGSVLMAGTVFALIMVASGRLRRSSSSARHLERKMHLDPLTSPIIPGKEKHGVQLLWTNRHKAAPAILAHVKEDDQPSTAPPIPLDGIEITFGTDPTLATHVLDDPSISPLHARLKKERDNGFYLLDQNSTAGTWVNYEALTDKPHRLQHGDLIHMGQVSFRFMLRKPPEKPKPRIIPQE